MQPREINTCYRVWSVILLESKSFVHASITRKFQQIFIETLDIFVTSLQIAGSVKSKIYELYNLQMCFPTLA